MSKKKIIIIVVIVIFVLVLIPVPTKLKDGSAEYKALLYEYTKIHRVSEQSATGYEDGWALTILGFHIGGEINTHILTE